MPVRSSFRSRASRCALVTMITRLGPPARAARNASAPGRTAMRSAAARFSALMFIPSSRVQKSRQYQFRVPRWLSIQSCRIRSASA